MLYFKVARVAFNRTTLVAGLAAAAMVCNAATAVAQDAVWDPETAKYNFTTIAGGPGTPSTTLDDEIEIRATRLQSESPVYLVQDNRGDRRGLGIGPDFKEEISGREVLEIATIPTGSAQGVSGVWLSNLYCGNDGANRGDDCDTSDGESNNQRTGEQASVEIDYLAADGRIACESFQVTGTETLGGEDDDQGDVFVDFGGEVLQMVGARISDMMPEHSEESSACPLKDDGETYTIGGNEFSVLGFVLNESINTQECNANEDCDAVKIPGLTVTIKNSPAGKFILANSYFLVDTRDYCQPGASANEVSPEELNVIVPGNGFDEVSFTIPANLCGIPNGDGVPQIWIQSIVSELDEGERFFDQVVDIVVENDPVDPFYGCLNPDFVGDKADNLIPNAAFNQPVQGWIPRNDGTELPVLDADGNPSYILRDVTTFCDGYGGNTRRLSNLVSNLHYVPTSDLPDFEAIVSTELDRLENTVEQTFACMSNGRTQSILSSNVSKIRKEFDKGRYEKAVKRLDLMRRRVTGQRISGQLLACTAELATGALLPPTPVDDVNIVPALVYGDLLGQIDHLEYQINDKLLNLRVDPPAAD